MDTKKFEFEGKVVEFEPTRTDIMVNATQMAKVFDKDVFQFLRTDNTENFIKAFCQTADLRFEDEFSPAGKLINVIKGGDKPGTWMDRRVALKFAAWLDPYFEVWIYNIIDQLLFGSYKEDDESLKKIAKIQSTIAAKKEALEKSTLQREIEELVKEEKKEQNNISLRKKIRLSSYRSMFSPEEMTGDTLGKETTDLA